MRSKLLDLITPMLEQSGFPWATEQGTRHLKIKICDRLVAILPLGGKTMHGERNRRATLNIQSQIRNHVKRLHNERRVDGLHNQEQNDRRHFSYVGNGSQRGSSTHSR